MPWSEKRLTGTNRLTSSPRASKNAANLSTSSSCALSRLGSGGVNPRSAHALNHATVASSTTMVSGSATRCRIDAQPGRPARHATSSRREARERTDQGNEDGDHRRRRQMIELQCRPGGLHGHLHEVGEVEDEHASRHPEDPGNRQPRRETVPPLQRSVGQLAARQAQKRGVRQQHQAEDPRHGEHRVGLAQRLAEVEVVVCEPVGAETDDRPGDERSRHRARAGTHPDRAIGQKAARCRAPD